MKKGIRVTITTMAVMGALVAAGCKSGATSGRHATAELNPASGSNVRGTVHFYETKGGVRVVAQISGLTPGKHGFHIHDKGDCSAPDAKSAGPHFNPTKMKHGGPTDAERHAGDFGNITADASGNATFKALDSRVSFDGANSIIGRGVIVHANEDDLKTQQSDTTTPGNAGPRVACGEIKMR
ncbi:MAG TPA: superoxide dismutase family protein [Verrucomicrobiae bacterium]|jgi:Cu-Zn family superoxide dismutase